MTHVITSLCLRDNGCSAVCPVECIVAGAPEEDWPTFYIESKTCIDCGACIPECPYAAIFHDDEVPGAFVAKGGEILNRAHLRGRYEGVDYQGRPVILETTRRLEPGEIVDLRDSIRLNAAYKA